LVCISRDVTRRIEAEQQREAFEDRLQRIQKLDAIGIFATGVAHDFRNLLLAISASTQTAKHKLDADHKALPSLELVDDACRQASEITQSLLTFAQGQGSAKDPIDLVPVIKDVINLLGAGLATNIKIQAEFPQEAGLWVHANRTELQQAFMNLLVNAKDAMEHGGDLKVSLMCFEKNQVAVTIEDTGCGMPEDVLKRAFEPFFTTKTRLKGTGLGLALVHGIITDHGGEIIMDSLPGTGTQVRILLPLFEPSAPGPPSPLIPETTSR